jgi:uncharacterized zinc-type alcohol dehydrogenase-like protein
MARTDWGRAMDPVVPGHAIVGCVTAVGPEVTTHKVGDHVAVGCFVDSCQHCDQCHHGNEHMCREILTETYNGRDRVTGETTYGGYSRHIVVKDDFVLRMPEGLDLSRAAPLLCAGITTYSPLRHWNAGPGKKVAVIGLGGLGHMAVKIAHALGAEVTVLSRSESKRDDALALGADHYFATGDPETFRTLRNRFDLIINSVSAAIDLDAHLKLLALDGTMVNVGVPSEPMGVRAGTLIGRRRSFAGSNIGGIAETQEMLDFCAEHGIAPEVEITTADQVNEAWARVLASDVRYRFVIDIESLVG